MSIMENHLPQYSYEAVAQSQDDKSDPVTRRESRSGPSRRWCLQFAGLATISLFILVSVLSTGTIAFTKHMQSCRRSMGKRVANESEICSSESCQAYARGIKASLATNFASLDPCADFNVYSCGGWMNTHDFRSEQSVVNSGSLMGDTIQALLHKILEGDYSPTNGSLDRSESNFAKENFQKMKSLYDTCMDDQAIRAYGTKPLIDILTEFESVYPRQSKAGAIDHDKQELTKAMIWLADHSVGGLMSVDNGVDDKNPDAMIVTLGSSEVTLSKNYYSKNKTIADLTEVAKKMKHVMNTGKPYYEQPMTEAELPALNEYAKNALRFELEIAHNQPAPEKSSEVDYFYQPRPIKFIEEMVPEIDTVALLKGIVPKEYPVTPETVVLVTDMDYYKNLSSIIKSTKREQLHDYFNWRLISTWAGKLHRNFTAPSREFNNRLSGKDPKNMTPRWRTCLAEVDSNVGYVLSAAFIEQAFTTKDKVLGDRIISDIKSIFKERLHQFDWMSPEVKEKAAAKVVNIVQKVGYQTQGPDTINPESVNRHYASLDLKADKTFFENIVECNRYARDKNWKLILKPVDRNDWSMTAPTVNAYYNPSGNEIVFPAGIMQLPVFSAELPEYVNYGAFGAVAGHELTHGFDNHGSQYDERGVLTNWWDNTTRNNFDKKAECFIGQYEKYTVLGPDNEVLHINGKLTEGENIADAGGLSAAYAAWKLREKEKPNQKLPGLENFTNDQMFFVAYSNWWCGKVRPAQKLNYILSDVHSPSEKRIIGTTANSADFLKAFNCPVKKPVCELW